MNSLYVVLAHSVVLPDNHIPYEVTLTYGGVAHDYWVLRGHYDGALGNLSNDEFLALITQLGEGTLPGSWETIAAEITAARAAAVLTQS